MVDVSLSFVLIGLIVFIGFLASDFFDRTKVPDILLLILLGLLLGPIFGVVDSSSLSSLIPFFAGLALIVVLFAVGMRFNLQRVISNVAAVSAFTVFAYCVAVVLISSVAFFLFRWELLSSVFLGLILSDTCPTIVSAVLPKLRTDEETKISISLEATISGALSTVFAVSLLAFHSISGFNFSQALTSVASAFSIAIVAGLIVGIVWLLVLKNLKGRPFAYFLTFASAALLYGAVESLSGNGAIAVFIFGMILGNAAEITRIFKMRGSFEPDKVIFLFQDEVTFFVRTFFFVYIGLVFRFATSLNVILLSIFALACILVSREIAIRFFKMQNHPTRILQEFVIPTGLAAVVLSFLPASKGVAIPGITDVVLLIVIATNVVTALAIYFGSKHPISPAGKSSGSGPKVVSVSKPKSTR